MSLNTQGFDSNHDYQEQTTNSDTLHLSQPNTASQSQAHSEISAHSPVMVLPSQSFGALLHGGGATSLPNQARFDLNGELKAFQQLQFGGPASSNSAFLLPNSNAPSSVQLNQASVTHPVALLQNILDQQKLQQNASMILGAGLNPLLTYPGLLQDARLLLAQSQLGCLLSSQPGTAAEVPLPSPHSLFHRDGSRRMRGGVIEPFPEKLHRLLTEVEAAGRSDVISFVANGRAFAIHKPDSFFKEIVPLYFRQSRLSSFKRQLNLYGFELINTGPSRGGYFHELFVREHPELCRRMRRVAVKLTPGKSEKDEEDDAQADERIKGENGGEIGDTRIP